MIWLNIGVEIRISLYLYIANLGLWKTLIRKATANRVRIYVLSFAFHWCTKQCSLRLCWHCSLNCCAYKFVSVTLWSIICSVMYGLKKSCSFGFLGGGTSILSLPVKFKFLGMNRSLGRILFYCKRGTIGILCLCPTCLRKPGMA